MLLRKRCFFRRIYTGDSTDRSLFLSRREVLGFSPRIWEALTETLRAGNDQLAANKYNLVPRVRDLVILARNLLATKEKAQNYASYSLLYGLYFEMECLTNLFCFYRDEGFEAEVRRLLDICVDKASKPIAANIDKQTHETEMHIKGNCTCQPTYKS